MCIYFRTFSLSSCTQNFFFDFISLPHLSKARDRDRDRDRDRERDRDRDRERERERDRDRDERKEAASASSSSSSSSAPAPRARRPGSKWDVAPKGYEVRIRSLCCSLSVSLSLSILDLYLSGTWSRVRSLSLV